MVSIPYALSVSHFINTVGADAGFAAIIGLALLVLLFFAQMRETSHLRDQVADATDHVSHLEHQIMRLTRGGGTAPGTAPAPGVAPVPGVAPRPASVPATAAAPAVATAAPAASRAVTPAPARAVAAAPIAPAGVGAPALASATRLIPAFDDGPISVRQAGAAAATGFAGAGAGAGAGAAASAGAGAPAQGSGGRDAAVLAAPGPPPATAAGGANGSTTSVPTPSPVGGGAPRTGQTGRPPAPRTGGRPTAPAAPRRTDFTTQPRSRLRGLLGALIALVVVAAIVVVLLLLTGGSSTPTASSSSTARASNAPTGHPRSHRAAAIKPASVTVAVLNGTSTNNLAHDVSVKLGAAAYKLGKIATATDQTHTATVVAYLPGHRAAALIVAKTLGLGAGVVAAVDPSSQAVACPPGAPCTAQVIVTVGSDLASAASSSTAPAAAPGTGTGAAAATGTG